MISPQLEGVSVDFLVLADRAEVLNGKLYLMGGGYTQRAVADFGSPIGLSLALGVLVPWHLTNREHRVTLRLEDDDGTEIEPKIDAEVKVGRPADATVGDTFRPIMAVEGQWRLSGPGFYRVVATIGDDRKEAKFFARDAKASDRLPS